MALLDLVQEGEMRPTAVEIARRASISRRALFKHFPQTELLRAAAVESAMEQQTSEFGRLRAAFGGSFSQRLAAFVSYRAKLLERVTLLRRAALIFEPFSPRISQGVERAIRESRQEVALVFSQELAKFESARRRETLAALSATLSWPYWNALRQQQHLSRAAARQTIAAIVEFLVQGSN
jgi:AcrR family transcriptional regulator